MIRKSNNSCGARFEIIAVGGVGEAYRVGEYWSEKLAHGAKVRSISLRLMRNNLGWKVTIKYESNSSKEK